MTTTPSLDAAAPVLTTPRHFGLEEIVDLALQEDIGTGDVTTLATVPADRQATGILLAKQDGIISGIEVARFVFARVDPTIVVTPLVADGDRVTNPTPIVRLAGSARTILIAERTALNIMQRLSGVATITAAYVAATAGTSARIVDTRKTTPGMRMLEKHAVRHGGGHNHRFGLADGILIKDNHLAAIGGPDRIATAIAAARELAPHTLRVEVEVATLPELDQALAEGADIVLLDNMDTATMEAAVARRDAAAPRVLLEASGGITLGRIPEIAATGVDLISVGALTHSAGSLDISLDLDLEA
ncbi:MAG: carboxylating nicotinate-nucleotide diphosphorylase [Thermomicrobiales bacterium]